MNSSDRCRPGPRAPTQFPPCGLGHRLDDAVGTAEPASADGEELLPTRVPDQERRCRQSDGHDGEPYSGDVCEEYPGAANGPGLPGRQGKRHGAFYIGLDLVRDLLETLAEPVVKRHGRPRCPARPTVRRAGGVL